MIRYNDSADITIRGVVLAGEIIVVNLVLLLLYFTYSHVVGGYLPSYKRAMVILSVIYMLCNLHAGMEVHKRFVMGEMVFRKVFINTMWYAAVSLLMLWTLHWPLIIWQFMLPYYVGILISVMLYRKTVREIIKHIRRRGFHKRRVIFVGQTKTICNLYQSMSFDKSTAYEVLGYFAEKEEVSENKNAAPYLGKSVESLAWLEQHYNEVDCLFCTLSTEWNPFINKLFPFCENHIIRFYSIPTNFDYTRRTMSMELMDGIPVFSLHDEPLSMLTNRIAKRTFDFVCSSLFLILGFPIIYLIFGTIIKLSSPGPIIFKQKRTGLDGKEFWCYKFRSMRVNADSDKLQATKDDPRKTKVGEFMRKTNIDELPQFINVWLGQMSMVGPRPHMLQHTDEYSQIISNYMLRHMVKPGITGYAQVTGFRGETDELWKMEGRVKKDVWYIEHWSFTLDLWIICKTFLNIGEKNAY